MSLNDTYSSDEEEVTVKNKSTTLLGFIDQKFDDDYQQDDEDAPTIEDTFVGGKPIWLHPNSRPSDEQLSCGNCGKKMALLLQAFVPLEDTFYDRVIYLFGCQDTRQCSKKNNSIKVFRGICKDPKKMGELEGELQKSMEHQLKLEKEKALQLDLTKDLFNNSKQTVGTNPFSNNSNPFSSNENPFAPAAKEEPIKSKEHEDHKPKSYSQVAQNAAPQKKDKNQSQQKSIELPEYPGYFVYVKNEKFKKINDPYLEKYKHLTEMDVDSSSRSGSFSGGKADKDVQLDPSAAKVSGMLDDKFFEAFSNKIQHNPSQVLRYELGGTPLLYSGKDSVAAKFLGKECTVPRPAYNPSSTRQFELQLMPKVIMDLEDGKLDSKTLLDGMEWGTIIVATDVEDYMPELDENNVGYVEEWVGVQWEESV